MLPLKWQDLLDILTSDVNSNNVIKKIAALRHQEQILEICLKEESLKNKLLEWIHLTKNNAETMKSISKSSKFRMWGNEKFKLGDNAGSLSLYTESLIFAPRDSEEQALASANRSAALFHLEAYQDCVRDIAFALSSSYPRNLHHKLHMRRSQCFSKLGKYDMAVEALHCAQKCVENLQDKSLSKSLKLDIEAALSKLTSMLRLEDTTEGKSEDIAEVNIPLPTHGENEKFVYASSALDLRCSDEKGRHVITNREVKLGDILFVEKPFTFVVLPDHMKDHCQHCCQKIMAPVPCLECTLSLYCSKECRSQSWTEYHQWECHGGLEIMYSIGIAHLGLRAVLKASPLSRLKNYVSMFKGSTTNVDEAYGDKEENYKAAYQLMPHFENMQQEDLFQYAMTACMLVLYLKHCTDYFKNMSEVQDEDMNLVGGAILRHIAQMVCNAHAITKLGTSVPKNINSEVVTERQVRVATAIFPSASMMNHSCDPSIINSFHNQYLIVRACKDIHKGEEVFNCYGPHYRHMGLKERQQVLKSQYFFTCTCAPCSLPLQEDFQERFSALLCSECTGPLLRVEKSRELVCSDCRHSQEYSNLVAATFKAHALFNEGYAAVEFGNVKEALDKFLDCWHLRRQCLYKSHRDLGACLDQIAKCYAMLEDYGRSVEYLLQCLPALEEQFGASSVEVANEIQKLTDVMICDIEQQTPGSTSFIEKHKKATEYVKRAKQILELHYGMWNTGLQDIVSKEHKLQQML